MAFRLSINLPENAKNNVLETLEITNFLVEHALTPPPEISRLWHSFCPPPPSFINLATPLRATSCAFFATSFFIEISILFFLDVDTRRRAACDFVRGLCKYFEAPVTAIFSHYVTMLLEVSTVEMLCLC